MGIQLSEEQLSVVEELAECLMKPDEIALFLEIDVMEFVAEIKKGSGPVWKKFITGKLKTETALRKTTITFAKQGSSPALTAALRMRDELNISLESR